MQDLNDLYYYVQVVDHRGFAPAGRALGMPKSKLSRRIAMLEACLGVRLLQRSTRQFSVTPVGQSFYERCQAMLIEAEAAWDVVALTQTEPRGIVRMSCPIALLHANVAAMLADFLVAHPLVSVQLEGTNRRVDPVGEGIDIAIRVRPPPLADSDLVMRVLADRCQCLVASPTLVAQHLLPKTPADLASWPSLGLGSSGENHVWRLLGPDGASAQQHHQPRFATSDMIALRAAAQAGVGVVQLPMMMVVEQLQDGSLMRVLPGWEPRAELIHAVFPSRRGMLPAVRALLDHLARGFSEIETAGRTAIPIEQALSVSETEG